MGILPKFMGPSHTAYPIARHRAALRDVVSDPKADYAHLEVALLTGLVPCHAPNRPLFQDITPVLFIGVGPLLFPG